MRVCLLLDYFTRSFSTFDSSASHSLCASGSTMRLTAALLKIAATAEVDEMGPDPTFDTDVPPLLVSAFVEHRCDPDSLSTMKEIITKAIVSGSLDAPLLAGHTEQLLTIMTSDTACITEQQLTFQLLFVGLDALDISDALEILAAGSEEDGVDNDSVLAMLPTGLLGLEQVAGQQGPLDDDEEDSPSPTLIGFMFRWLLVLHKYCTADSSISEQARSMLVCALSNAMMLQNVMGLALPWLPK